MVALAASNAPFQLQPFQANFRVAELIASFDC
jgi:hypothetical protein